MNLLKILLSITYYFIFFSCGLLLLLSIFIWFNFFPSFTEVLKDVFEEDYDYFFSIEYYIGLIAIPMYLIMIKKMRALVSNFSQKDYFSLINSKYIKEIGYLFIAIYTIENIICEYVILFINNNYSINILTDINIVEVFLIAFYKCMIGLLLLCIGKAFELGLKQKQENELTI